MGTPRRPARLLAVALAAGLVLGAAACGSDEGSDALTKSEFIDQADAICKAGAARIDKRSDEVDRSDQASVDEFVTYAAESTLDQIAKVRDLGFPEGDEQELDEAFTVYETQFEALAKDPSKINDGADPAAKEAQATMKAYGFEECGV